MSDDAAAGEVVTDQAGRVGFWAPLDRFSIGFSVHGTIDATVTGILTSDMPAAFRTPGLSVVFSGRLYRDARTPAPRLGGEKAFWLELSAIRAAPAG